MSDCTGFFKQWTQGQIENKAPLAVIKRSSHDKKAMFGHSHSSFMQRKIAELFRFQNKAAQQHVTGKSGQTYFGRRTLIDGPLSL